MSRFSLKLIAIAGLGFVTIIGLVIYFWSANSVENTSNLKFFKSLPAKEIMSENEFKYYTRALENLDCELADILLNTAFVREYSKFEQARLKRRCLDDIGCSNWKMYASSIFDELNYCEAVSYFNEANYEIGIRGLTPPKFNLKLGRRGVKYENYWVEARDGNIALLIALAQAEYVPALVKIGELLRSGDVFVQMDDIEYYIWKRACFLGYEACAELGPRLTELRGVLPPERIASIEGKSKGGPLELLRLKDLLVDKTL